MNMLLDALAQKGELVAGLELLGSGDTYVMNHIKRSVPASAFARVHARSRVNRFFNAVPQLEELPTSEQQKLRCIFGEKVSLELATWLSDDTPQFCVTLSDPVTMFLGRHEDALKQADGPDLQALIDEVEIDNPVSRSIAAQLGDIEFHNERPDLDTVINLLKRAQFVFMSDYLGVQAAALFKFMGIGLRGEDVPDVSEWSDHDISEAQIETLMARHDVDAELFETVMIAHAEQEDRTSNPLGFDRGLLAHDVGLADKTMPDQTTMLTRAYRDLLDEIQLEHQTEALLVLLEHGAIDHLSEEQVFYDVVAETDFGPALGAAPHVQSKFNAGLFALRQLSLPKVAKHYAEEALNLDPDHAAARRLFARAKAAA